MEAGLKLWKQLFGRVREVDYEDFQEIFHAFVRDFGDSDLDDYQMRYIREQVDPDKQFRVTISDFLIFFKSFWSVPSKRKQVFDYDFVIADESQSRQSSTMSSHNDFECIKLTISNKFDKSPIKYLTTGSSIDVYRDKLVLNSTQVQQLNKLDVLRMGSDIRSGQNDIIFPDTLDIQPIHCKIGIGTSGYYVKDMSKRTNRMRFIIGSKKPLMLDYKCVFEIGSSGCKFYVKRIFPEPVFDGLSMNQVNYVFTGQVSLEAELEDFQQKQLKRSFHSVREWRDQQIQEKKNQKAESETQKDQANKDIAIEIECFEGELKGQTFTLKGMGASLSIGRDKNSSIHLKHVSVSQNHAVIAYNKTYGSWMLKEPTQTLGTYVYLANYDQYIGSSNSNFHMLQQDLPFELYNYVFDPTLQYKALEDL